MKTQLHLLTAIATALGTTLAGAQNDRRPEPLPQVRPTTRQAVPTRPAAFLGVATLPVPPVLAAQLGLPEGFGLVVDEVMPDGPAGKAGVLRFDVLRLFNDQQLLNPDQLAALVRAQGKDSEVTLTVLRKGQEQKLSMKIAERPKPVRMPSSGLGGEMQERAELLKDGLDEKSRRLQEQSRDFERRMREYQERLKNWRGNPGAEIPKPPGFHPSTESSDIRREVRPDGSVTSNTSNAKVLMKDDSGSIEITSTDGRRHLIAKNAKDEVVFDGPIDTREQLRALPEDLRKKVESVKIATKAESDAPIRPLRPEARREAE